MCYIDEIMPKSTKEIGVLEEKSNEKAFYTPKQVTYNSRNFTHTSGFE